MAKLQQKMERTARRQTRKKQLNAPLHKKTVTLCTSLHLLRRAPLVHLQWVLCCNNDRWGNTLFGTCLEKRSLRRKGRHISRASNMKLFSREICEIWPNQIFFRVALQRNNPFVIISGGLLTVRHVVRQKEWALHSLSSVLGRRDTWQFGHIIKTICGSCLGVTEPSCSDTKFSISTTLWEHLLF